MHRSSTPALVGISLLVAPFSAANAADLRWDSPPNCQRSDTVSEQVEALIHRPLDEVEALEIRVAIRQDGDAWTLDLVTRTAPTSATRKRTVTGRSCAEISDAAAVLVAMAIQDAAREPSAEDSNPGSETQTSEETTTPIAESPPALPTPPHTPAPARRAPLVSSLLAAGVIGDSAALPGGSLGFAVDAGLRYGALRAEFEGTALAPRTRELAAGQSAEFSFFAGALLGCVEGKLRPVLAFGCGGFELGRLSGEGRGVINPRVGSATWQAARFDLGLAFPSSGSLRFHSRVGVVAALARPSFQLDQKDAYRTGAMGGRVWVGVELSP